LNFAYLLATVSVSTAPFGGLVKLIDKLPTFGYWPAAGDYLFLVISSFIIYVPASALTLIEGARSRIGVPASQMNFVLGSATIGFFGGLTNFPLWYEIPIPPYGNVTVFVYLLMVGYGVYNRRITGMSVDIFKAFIFILLSMSIALFYILGVAIYGIMSDTSFAPAQFWTQGLIAFTASSTLLWGIPKLKLWSEKVLDAVLRKEHLTTVELLNNLPVKLSNLTDEKEIYRSTNQSLMDILQLTGTALFNRGIFDSQYRCVDSVGTFLNDIESLSFDINAPFVQLMNSANRCIVVDQIFEEIPKNAEKTIVELKELYAVSAVLPIISGKEMYGIILLGQTGNNSYWTDENIALLYSIGAQLGLNFKSRELERRTNEVDKLVSLGTMAAGLAHEIRNPLVSIQTFADLMAKGRSTDSLNDSFKSALLRDVKRISSIVEGVAMFSENRAGPMRPVKIAAVIEESFQIYKELIEKRSIEFSISTDQNLTTHGNFDQLVQVINNLIENGIQAMNDTIERRIKITASEIRGGYEENWVELKISDTGPGIQDTIRERIFDPFITSKDTGQRSDQKGMGLGLAITKKIIENHGGAISVKNIPSGGACFVVSLKSSNLNK
jgi:two-component system nitrogen regulation sensor histidine kinase GlnL